MFAKLQGSVNRKGRKVFAKDARINIIQNREPEVRDTYPFVRLCELLSH
jgi:hypothetical protein